MHPIERLRYVARADGAGPTTIAREAAGALAAIGNDPAGMVTGCRRLLARHVTAGPLWWVSARVLASGEPVAEARRAASDLDDDRTVGMLASCLPEDSTVTVIGWPEQVAEALRKRADLEVLVVDCGGEGTALARRLEAVGVDAYDVPESGLGAAVADSALVVLEAVALGPDGFVAAAGSRAAAAVARAAGIPVWVAAGTGRVLPKRLWEALCLRLSDQGEAWEQAEELVPLELADSVVGPKGPQSPDDAVKRADCPVVPELLKDAF